MRAGSRTEDACFTSSGSLLVGVDTSYIPSSGGCSQANPADFHYKIQHGGRVREFRVSENVAKYHLLPYLGWNVSSYFKKIESSGHSGRSSFSKRAATHER